MAALSASRERSRSGTAVWRACFTLWKPDSAEKPWQILTIDCQKSRIMWQKSTDILVSSKQNLLFTGNSRITGIFPSVRGHVLVYGVSFSRFGDGREMGDRGILFEDGTWWGGEERTGVFSLKDSLRGEHRGAQRCLGGEPSIEAGRLQPFSSPGKPNTLWINAYCECRKQKSILKVMINTPVRLRGLRGSLSDRGVFFNTVFLGDWQTLSKFPTFVFLGDKGVVSTPTSFSQELLGRDPNLEDFLLGNCRVGWFCERVLGIFMFKTRKQICKNRTAVF